MLQLSFQSNRFSLLVRILVATALLQSLAGCYVFRKKGVKEGGKQGSTTALLGASLGDKAGEVNETALLQVYAVKSTHAPAGIRPDPDTLVRELLLQYREQGAVVAREIGRVEQYRMLLGGANNNFSIVPQEGYDATSLLAELKVAEEICTGLVNPSADRHSGWESILPADPSDSTSNIRYLTQRLTGVPSARIAAESVTRLQAILQTQLVNGQITKASYVPVCATLLIDAEALLL